MTPDAGDNLAFRIGELMRADIRIATLAHGHAGDPEARAAAILEAIADRERVAGAVLAEVAREDRALQSGMTAGSTSPGPVPGPSADLIRRDRSIEALVSHVEDRSRAFNQIARRLERARHPDDRQDRVRL